MASYVSSNANRFYTVLESTYGQVPTVTTANRIPAVKLAIRQQRTAATRRDKTGSRTFAGLPPGGRRETAFQLNTYMTNWNRQAGDPCYGPLFQAGLGAAPQRFGGAAAGAGSHDATLVMASASPLCVGQGVTHEGEIRFVSAVVNATTVVLNAPFSATPAAGSLIGATVTYMPATELPSASIYDYWSPSTAVQRILCGAAVDKLQIQVNGDFHEFQFSGVAQDVLDNSSFESGVGQLQSFPAEPATAGFDYTIVPGHMGQAWLGTSASRFHTITGATFLVDNDVDVRSREFGSNVPKGIAPGRRSVKVSFDLFEMDDEATRALYEASRQDSPISVMFQLGEVEGQMVGVYLKSVLPEVPEFNDGDRRLQWSFREARALGTSDDEIAVAFG